MSHALDYQAEVRRNFDILDQKAKEQFDPRKTKAFKVKNSIEKYNSTKDDVLFHHIPLNGNPEIRLIYENVLKIVKDVVGTNVPLLETGMEEEHVAIASDDVALGKTNIDA